ncbi:hypothetical protein [Paenibacillus sp. OAS669]|uniref:hypothetical protein n=1 Tax=Paenibacillus sp. OAS669 TaxID=2663821 RepID=UPI00178BDF2A|nr:hypothetical protein [Paenibacillus sp. OAS669]MBE1446718.1 hypothetical protein [Paenibacillus sp. OAS669]
MYGWLGFDFPDVGTRVMVLMQQSSSLVLTGEVNSVAIVEDNQKVKLYQGTTMGQWTPELYEEAYSAYLAGQISSFSEPKNMDNPNDSGAVFGVMPAGSYAAQSICHLNDCVGLYRSAYNHYALLPYHSTKKIGVHILGKEKMI